jgi:hypothetical protein
MPYYPLYLVSNLYIAYPERVTVKVSSLKLLRDWAPKLAPGVAVAPLKGKQGFGNFLGYAEMPEIAIIIRMTNDTFFLPTGTSDAASMKPRS